MGNDVYTYILLEGDEQQKQHFINHHKNSQNQIEDGDVWDCEPFLKLKKCEHFLLYKEDYFCTGGRFSQGKNSDNIDFISLESKCGFCEEAIKALSQYYDKLTIKLDYRDEDYQIGLGWLIIKNGEVLGEDFISLSKVEDYIFSINNEIEYLGENKDTFLKDFKKYIDTCYGCEIDSNIDLSKWTDNHKVCFTSYNEPSHNWVLNYSKTHDNVNLKYIYRELKHKFYGYVIVNNSNIICDKFINLEHEPFSEIIDYFKYNDLNDFLIKRGIRKSEKEE